MTVPPATRCPRCGYANIPKLPFCGYCYRRFRDEGDDSADVEVRVRSGPAAAEAWARRQSAGADLARSAWPTPPAEPAPFRPLVGLATVAQLLLAATALVAAAAGSSALVRLLAMLVRGDNDPPGGGGGDSGRLAATIADRAASVGSGTVVVGVAALMLTGTVFVAWGRRAYRNLPALGITDGRWWTTWTVVGWLIPGANLFVPKLVMDDLWRASNPSLPLIPGPGWSRRPVGAVVHRWWRLWLGAPAIYVLVLAASGTVRGSSLDRARVADVAALLAALALIGAAQAARQIVAIVSLAQHRRVAVLTGAVAATERARADRAAPAARTRRAVDPSLPRPAPVTGLTLREVIEAW
jgi:Domain of unknown function (DUF4328)